MPDDYVHYLKNRILTVREMARLQSFPDWFESQEPKSTREPRRKFDVPSIFSSR
ncbi:MAG: DNA cytosine methyltransferase [DPANN group archaeon]|nr:DNA cytosine methyltransferase [DPANN group archaeon]